MMHLFGFQFIHCLLLSLHFFATDYSNHVIIMRIHENVNGLAK